MMFYILYLISSVLTFWMILFLYGVSAGFSNYAPMLALGGSVLLFSVVLPVLIYKPRMGLILGLVGCVLMLPYNLMFANGILEDGVFNWGIILISLPILLLLFNTYTTVKKILDKTPVYGLPSKPIPKLILSGIPILLLVLYIIFYGKYWSWGMFSI